MQEVEIINESKREVNASPMSLIELAIEKGTEISQLERLMALKERWDAQQAKKAYLEAFSQFQNEVPVIEKKKVVSFNNTKYKYAELGEIDETIKGVLFANGLSKRWEIADEGDRITVTCIVSHVDGHSEKTSMWAHKDQSGGKNDIQSRASAVSYMQRYTLIAALGLTTANEDNDAQGAPEPVPVQKQQTIKQQPEPPHSPIGAWYARMESCKVPSDVKRYYQVHKKEVDSRPELQKLLRETMDSLKIK